MAIGFAATSLSDFINTSGTVTATSVSTEIADYVLEGVNLGDGANIQAEFDAFAVNVTDDEIWVSIELSEQGTNSGHNCSFEFLDGSGNEVFRIRFINAGTSGYDVDIWDGSAYSTVLSGTGSVTSSAIRFDFQIVWNNTTGAVRGYREGVLDAEATAVDTILNSSTSVTSFDTDCSSTTGSDGLVFSALILADEDTRDMIFVQEDFTAEGALNTFSTGGFDEVDDVAGVNDSDAAVSDATGQQLTLVGTLDNVIDTGYDIVAAVTKVRAVKAGSAVNNIAALSRISSTNYTSTAQAVDTTVEILQFIEDVSPATSLAWTASELEDMESGVQTS